jgi:capsid portal protein
MLRFPDNTQVRVIGLDEILAVVYSEGRQANKETAEEIIKRLEAQQNYIPSSDLARKEFAYVLLKEYKDYIESRTDNKG